MFHENLHGLPLWGARIINQCRMLLAVDCGKTGILRSIHSAAQSPQQQSGQTEKVRLLLRACDFSSDCYVAMEGYAEVYVAQMEALYNYEIPVIRQLQMA